MRNLPLALFLALALPGAASAQAFELYGSAGPTVSDAGNSLAAGVGFSPNSRLTVVFAVERTHLSSRLTREHDFVSGFRGGTLLLGTGELRVAPLGRGRLGPFGLVGAAAGVSRPNVNEQFRDPITNDVRALFVGGGVEVPLGDRLSLFGDFRMMLGAEGTQGTVAVAPVRASIAWRF